MKLLLDTHTLVWWLNNNSKLSSAARTAIADTQNEIFVSAATAWELGTKVRLGRWPDAERLVAEFHPLLAAEGFELLAIESKHGLLAGGLPGDHGDPFDRMLAAQAQIDGMSVITLDPAIIGLGAPTIW
jgi:PIN domain nuclease of toxin-antitoxin system